MTSNSIWVIDTETSNNGIWKPEPGGHIVEFGMVEVDLDRGKVGKGYSAVVCDLKADPDAWVFKNTDLSYMEMLKGVDPKHFQGFIAKILKGQTVTAYNVDFDRLMIQRDMPQINESVTWGNCLMKASAQIDEIPRRHAGQRVYPTAEAAYNYLCPDDPCNIHGKERHRALADAQMEGHILLELNDRGLFA